MQVGTRSWQSSPTGPGCWHWAGSSPLEILACRPLSPGRSTSTRRKELSNEHGKKGLSFLFLLDPLIEGRGRCRRSCWAGRRRTRWSRSSSGSGGSVALGCRSGKLESSCLGWSMFCTQTGGRGVKVLCTFPPLGKELSHARCSC